MSLQYNEFGLLTAEIGWRVWGAPTNFNGFRVLASLLHRRRSTKVNQTARCLALSWAGTLYIHYWGLLPTNGILPGAKFTLRPSLAFSYIGSVTARHLSSGRQPNFAAFSRGRHLYPTGRPSRWASAHILVKIFFARCVKEENRSITQPQPCNNLEIHGPARCSRRNGFLWVSS